MYNPSKSTTAVSPSAASAASAALAAIVISPFVACSPSATSGAQVDAGPRAQDASVASSSGMAGSSGGTTSSTSSSGAEAETGAGNDAAGEASSPGCGGGAAEPSDVSINVSSLQQHITGFGVSSAWAGSFRNASDPDYLWSTTMGAGLTLLRIRVGDDPTIAQAAVKYGVTVWATPWEVNGSDTTNMSNPNGCNGSMPVLTNPQDWATGLTSFVQSMKSAGVPIYAVSAENEPDSCGINGTTSYSPAQLTTWIANYLGPAMMPLGVKVMAPESENVCGFTGYFSAIQSNTTAWGYVNIFASHEYGCGTLPSEPSIASADKEYWETEVDTGVAMGDSTPNGDDIASAIGMAQTMHNDLTKANLNAWHYWWLYESGSGGLYDTGSANTWTKRLWVMGNYSRFVRPGYMRVATSGTAPSGVLITAYVNPKNDSLSIVAINPNMSSASVPFYISGNAPCSLTPYETSATNSLAALPAVTVSNSRVTVTLTAQSVTTFVGTP